MITPASVVWLQLGQLLLMPVLITLLPQLLQPEEITLLLPQLLQPEDTR